MFGWSNWAAGATFTALQQTDGGMHWEFQEFCFGLGVCMAAGGSDGKEAACGSGGPGSIPGSGRSPGKGNGNQFRYSCLENSIDRGGWRAIVHEVTKNRTQLSN